MQLVTETPSSNATSDIRVAQDEPDLRPLQEALDALRASPGRAELAHALVTLGRVLGGGERYGFARGEIARGLQLTHQVGGMLLAQSAQGEAVISGVSPLTACERRVAEMSAAQMTSREVAQALFVTEKTVAAHLTQAYSKLGIGSRAELPRALGMQAARPRSCSSDQLTGRELEVLRLVARGLTDAQAASDLVVSTRTVNAHLRSVYRKLGVRSRGAATRYAVEHDLA